MSEAILSIGDKVISGFDSKTFVKESDNKVKKFTSGRKIHVKQWRARSIRSNVLSRSRRNRNR